ncbi:hypothetical protein [Companilactobacillus furfuricola]|uniref:hypothetical protein n=1 Tax=Companilactobacillus furfuricola TaxID=1462575 RepID=UPI000F7AF5B6|nr:hypothetical protein [Companilactobacillus furfuricola]
MKKLFYSIFCSSLLAVGAIQLSPATASAQPCDGSGMANRSSRCDGTGPKMNNGNQQRRGMGQGYRYQANQQRMGQGYQYQAKQQRMNQATNDQTQPFQGPCYLIRQGNYQLQQNDFLSNCLRMNSTNYMNQ